ncbi:phospholipase D-like domain-containing protein DpdK [Rheinheimera sp. UJ63]|uniref:phospholipase D-like domain-containing protein DpdK n=1 Tax=Rheinheimera sp. UJ63 TaxID=2910157 RepID=UPI001F295D58|nr:phospholipase D-like domain-containing protein DpdK [Rheinheimera sp. UJ63]MCF4010631.1 phospholipase D-like domain-containing protein [Rheinheimera sp. UJ63]
MTKSPLGKRELREVLSSIFAGVIIVPQDLWLVTAWLTDFDVLDNRSGNWSYLNPDWGPRQISFLELLETAVKSGCSLRVVVKKDNINEAAVYRLQTNLGKEPSFRICESHEVHIKGLLTESCFLKGSMNFTYSGANKNEELVSLTGDEHQLSNARIEFRETYKFEPRHDTTQYPTSYVDKHDSNIEEGEDEHEFF